MFILTQERGWGQVSRPSCRVGSEVVGLAGMGLTHEARDEKLEEIKCNKRAGGGEGGSWSETAGQARKG